MLWVFITWQCSIMDLSWLCLSHVQTCGHQECVSFHYLPVQNLHTGCSCYVGCMLHRNLISGLACITRCLEHPASILEVGFPSCRRLVLVTWQTLIFFTQLCLNCIQNNLSGSHVAHLMYRLQCPGLHLQALVARKGLLTSCVAVKIYIF